MNIDMKLETHLTAIAIVATQEPMKTVNHGVGIGIVSGMVETKVLSRPG